MVQGNCQAGNGVDFAPEKIIIVGKSDADSKTGEQLRRLIRLCKPM